MADIKVFLDRIKEEVSVADKNLRHYWPQLDTVVSEMVMARLGNTLDSIQTIERLANDISYALECEKHAKENEEKASSCEDRYR